VEQVEYALKTWTIRLN